MTVKTNILLAEHTTMRVGGPASFFIEANTIEDIREGVSFAKKENLPIFVLGGGSNILMSDHGFPGVVLKMNLLGTQFLSSGEKVRASAYAGENWDRFVEETVRRNLHGLENLSLIPGTVGAAPIQNIGAYGMEASEMIEWVETFDSEVLVFRTFTNSECAFRYRDSFFKKNPNLIVTKVAFLLDEKKGTRTEYRDLKRYFEESKNTSPSVSEVRAAVVAIRKAKLPDPAFIGNTGSFFKNLIIPKTRYFELVRQYKDLPSYPVDEAQVKIPLAWVLDTICGLKGVRSGHVGLHETQPLVVVHHGGGTAEEIKNFSETIRDEVERRIGIRPEYEVLFIGTFD